MGECKVLHFSNPLISNSKIPKAEGGPNTESNIIRLNYMQATKTADAMAENGIKPYYVVSPPA